MHNVIIIIIIERRDYGGVLSENNILYQRFPV